MHVHRMRWQVDTTCACAPPASEDAAPSSSGTQMTSVATRRSSISISGAYVEFAPGSICAGNRQPRVSTSRCDCTHLHTLDPRNDLLDASRHGFHGKLACVLIAITHKCYVQPEGDIAWQAKRISTG